MRVVGHLGHGPHSQRPARTGHRNLKPKSKDWGLEAGVPSRLVVSCQLAVGGGSGRACHCPSPIALAPHWDGLRVATKHKEQEQHRLAPSNYQPPTDAAAGGTGPPIGSRSSSSRGYWTAHWLPQPQQQQLRGKEKGILDRPLDHLWMPLLAPAAAGDFGPPIGYWLLAIGVSNYFSSRSRRGYWTAHWLPQQQGILDRPLDPAAAAAGNTGPPIGYQYSLPPLLHLEENRAP
jgi:hypothetical protein